MPTPPPVPPMAAPVAQRERTTSIVILIVATVLYALSLLPWMLMLMMSPMLYDMPQNAPIANVLLSGILGWPVAILVGLVVGWIKRTYKAAILGSLAPILWAVLIAAVTTIVAPGFWGFGK